MGENWSQSSTRVSPLVDNLFEHSGVGMLRDEAGPQQFDPLSRNLFDHGRVVEEPPATKRHEIVEFSRVDTEFVLILPAEHAY